ncbi:MAG: ribose-phosphate pyrophosphokinase [Candidatus Hydrogenedentota bacterium]|nr:MAG: ribose-phosphate pyrophosphokinase [Candidatus Hydrogenedentota bacterium]
MLKLFSGSAHEELARLIASHLEIELGKVELKKFSDGELSVKIAENVRGDDVFVVQPTGYPANDNIMQLLLMIDALKRASARRITAVIPYYGYGRQDRKVEPRVPISAKVVASLIENIGAHRVLSMDLHADQIQGFFDIPVDHLFAAPVMIEYFRKKKLDNLVIVSPDSGGAERARFFAKQLHAGLAIIDKRRPKANVSEVMHIVGDVKGKNCIVVDDMIDTAGTICKAARALKENGANSIYIAATHGVLSGAAKENLLAAPADEIVLANTLPIHEEKRTPNMVILSIAPLMAEAIRRIHEERSVSSLFI